MKMYRAIPTTIISSYLTDKVSDKYDIMNQLSVSTIVIRLESINLENDEEIHLESIFKPFEARCTIKCYEKTRNIMKRPHFEIPFNYSIKKVGK